ncbi:MAG: hypothetical protein JRI36_14070 [Deltaproteobacteria bacterium]|nr:hypothetical protein [Deltaproteobacteria bacterium]
MLRKAGYVWRMGGHSCNACILVTLLFTFLILAAEARRQNTETRKLLGGESMLAGLLVLFTMAAALQPTPLFPQYFVMPISFAIVFIGSCYGAISIANRRATRTLLACVAIVAVLFGGVRLFKYIHRLHRTDTWTAIAVHLTAEDIRDHIDEVEVGGKVATLSPLYAIEAELPIYRELSTGPFLYRVGDLIPDDQKHAFSVVSKSGLQALFDIESPSAILVGFEGHLDSAFASYAKQHGYVKIDKDFNGGTLYVRQ